MPKDKKELKPKIKNKKATIPKDGDSEDIIITELDDDDEVIAPAVIAPHEELDPDVLEAINATKQRKKKAPTASDLDYVPELDRDFSFEE